MLAVQTVWAKGKAAAIEFAYRASIRRTRSLFDTAGTKQFKQPSDHAAAAVTVDSNDPHREVRITSATRVRIGRTHCRM